MLKDITEVKLLDGYRLFLRFEDGAHGEVDISRMIPFEGVFLPLKDPEKFREVRIDRELGTICWPNGPDLDPDVLYARVTGETIPEFEQGR